MTNKDINTKTVILYGILGIPIAFLGFPLYIYLPTFYVERIGLGVGIVGFILLVSRLIDMIADPFIGRFCDTYNTKFNIILISSFFVLIGLFFLINPLYHNYLWLFIFSILILSLYVVIYLQLYNIMRLMSIF